MNTQDATAGTASEERPKLTIDQRKTKQEISLKTQKFLIKRAKLKRLNRIVKNIHWKQKNG